MSEIERRRQNDIAPSVKTLLAAFHEDTRLKLERAPADSTPLYHRADGSLCGVDEHGWLVEYDDLDKDEVISIKPTSVRDREDSEVEEMPCNTTFLD
ncbi:hypothetical protein OG874_31485 [Nocardia sp. NBC_00565]|uniref:hypothetical protein n=1 Tax=Nocardia sp. NBC_00565 TaxID=2975993 RepID=UPI002E819A35|nr:hypothetical protein [Nocardia sp. NBC_00565]WUC01299.1 hypothetical protein OG874_31485 [Nocardia sp. NBC_00565]